MKLHTVIVVGTTLVLLAGCSSLPSYSASDTKSLVEQIVNQRSSMLGKFVELKDIDEIAFNQEREIRVCSAQLTTTRGTQDIDYSITWQNKKEGRFFVEIN